MEAETGMKQIKKEEPPEGARGMEGFVKTLIWTSGFQSWENRFLLF